MVNCVSVILKIENNSFKDKMYSNRVMVMIFNDTFNHISVISWRSVLLVEETRVPGENHQPVARY
jgi:hypothetical protein